MDEIKFENFNGKEILYVDYSNCGKDTQKVIAILDEILRIYKENPTKAYLAVTNVQNFSFDTEVINKFKAVLPTTNQYIKHQAVIGINDAVRRFLYNSITKFTGTNAPIFDTKEEAMEWLVSQP